MKYEDVKPGMKVRYHPIIGGKHDGNLYTVRDTCLLLAEGIAFLDGKAGCVDVRALSVPMPGADNYGHGLDG